MKKIVIGALILSILHSILFYGQDLGISVVLFVVPMLIFISYTLISKNKVKNKKAFFLSVPISFLSLTYALFNNGILNVVNMIAIVVLTTTMITWAIYDKFTFKEAFVKIFVIIFKPFGYIGESVRVISNNLFKKKTNVTNVENKKIKENKVIKQIIIGLIISIPLLIIILALLISADTIFAEILEPIKYVIMNIFNIKFLSSLYFRAIFIIILFIYVVAFICSMLKFDTTKKTFEKKGVNMQNITVNTVLTVLNIVYLLFCIIQFVYLFLFTNLGLNEIFDYATYARRGFFQLMFVTIINFIIIIITSLNKRETTKGVSIYTKIMNVLLIIFTIVMIFSSFLRMYLYEQEYGYTFLRLVVYFILATELMLAVPTCVYVFNKKISLLKYYIVIFSVMLVLLNFTNVDRTIAKKNVDKYLMSANFDEKEIDFKYLKNLSVDAIPEIARLYRNTPDSTLKNKIDRYFTHDSMVKSRNNKKIQKLYENKNFQEFNLSEYEAKRAVESIDGEK